METNDLECCAEHGTTLACLDKPANLNAQGTLAYDALRKFLIERRVTYTGGCRAFYSPEEWAERGETYCRRAALIVVYDGGALRSAMSLDGYHYNLNEAMQEALHSVGFYFEEGTGWYGGCYLL